MKEEKEKKINGILSLNQLEEIKSNLIPTDLIPKNILQETLKTLKPKIEEIIINNLGIEGLNYFNYIIINPTFSEEGICTFEIDCSVAALKMLENQENNIKITGSDE